MPLTATIAPPTSACAAAATGSAVQAPTSRTRGPHSGQALGWAWKRRLAGSRYSARQAGHIWKPAMVVFGRS